MPAPLGNIPDLKIDESAEPTVEEPVSELYSHPNGSNSSFTHSNAYRYSRSRSPKRVSSPIRKGSPTRQQPFRFGSITMNNSNENLSLKPGSALPMNGPRASYRRGHRYKHSSVSMNMFQEPPKRTSVPIPQQYPLPTYKEVVATLSLPDKLKLTYCGFLILLSLATYLIGFKYGNLCLSTLSHLVFYDSIGNLITVIVQVMTNFPIWNDSSLKYPFGLGRIEVLAGFGLSVSLLFVGVDLFSHIFENIMFTLALGDLDEAAHAHHVHGEKGHLNLMFYECYLLAICFVTLLSPRLISKMKKPAEPVVSRPKRISSITLQEEPVVSIKSQIKKTQNQLSNYTSILSIGYATYAMMYPLLAHIELVTVVNELSSLILAFTVLFLAWRLISRLSGILLLRNPRTDIEPRIVQNIQSLEVYKSSYKIGRLKISKVNHKIYVVILSMRMAGASDDDESKMRFYASRIIRSIMCQDEAAEVDLNAEFDYMDQSGEQFEITIDIQRV
ncbi:hypothetical protein KL928_000826 [Ogataea angusta]|uniref:Zinc transporter n=1 Tax=Pichia angusta TaxID=870730 RepID=A0AAN6DHN0_PICAN|nr:uncharacterized protein KL928_000826 [Ogataea angusta]KAG7820742.1 hypothetical protein KL928_000826 [Ogataea angusta]KAG7835869.1 hypothetical protein KL943_001518 [Ogataea angusta]